MYEPGRDVGYQIRNTAFLEFRLLHLEVGTRCVPFKPVRKSFSPCSLLLALCCNVSSSRWSSEYICCSLPLSSVRSIACSRGELTLRHLFGICTLETAADKCSSVQSSKAQGASSAEVLRLQAPDMTRVHLVTLRSSPRIL